MQPLRGSQSSELLRRLRPSNSRQTLHEGAGVQASRVYQQWRSQVEAQYGLPAWKRSQQDLAKGIELGMKKLIGSELLARLQNPTDADADEAKGTTLHDLVRLASSLGEDVLKRLPEKIRKSLETAALAHEAVGALARSFAMQLIHEDGTCIGTVDENLKGTLLLKETGRYIEQYQQKHKALPSLETLQAWVAQCDEWATKAATNREWLSGLSEKVFEECCPLLKKRDEAWKRWLSTEESPAFYVARTHLQSVVKDSLPDILRTSPPYQEQAARDFDKEVQDRMSLWVATAWALPGVLGKWKSHQEALKKAKQSDAAQPKLSPKASAYLAEMRQACDEKLERLRQRDGTSDSDNVVLVASLDEKLKRKLLQKRVMAKVTGAWQGGRNTGRGGPRIDGGRRVRSDCVCGDDQYSAAGAIAGAEDGGLRGDAGQEKQWRAPSPGSGNQGRADVSRCHEGGDRSMDHEDYRPTHRRVSGGVQAADTATGKRER